MNTKQQEYKTDIGRLAEDIARRDARLARRDAGLLLAVVSIMALGIAILRFTD